MSPKRISVSLSDEQAAWIEERADRTGLSQSDVIAKCVEVTRNEDVPLLGVATGGDLNSRLDELESRIENLETDSNIELDDGDGDLVVKFQLG